MAEYERKVRSILTENGAYFHRQGKGDHEIWISPHSQKPITVDGKIKSRYMANKILKEAGLDYKFK